MKAHLSNTPSPTAGRSPRATVFVVDDDVSFLRSLSRLLRAYRFRLLAWYNHPISTAALEGTNNKIKTLQRRAYGYRDQQYFTLRIYDLHETKYALVG